MVIKRYRKFVRKTRKGIKKANKLGLKAAWTAIRTLQLGQNVERKYFDQSTSISGTVTDLSPYLFYTPFDGLTQGTGPSDRIGDQVKALWVQMKSRLEWVPAAASGTNNMCRVRILVVMDTEARGNVPVTAAQVRDAILATTATGPQQITSPYKVLNTVTWGAVGDRWKVLRDFKIMLDQNHKQKDIKVNINLTRNKFRGLKLKYTEADQTVDDRLYMIAVTEHTVSNDIVVTGDYCRMCYVDN